MPGSRPRVSLLVVDQSIEFALLAVETCGTPRRQVGHPCNELINRQETRPGIAATLLMWNQVGDRVTTLGHRAWRTGHNRCLPTA